MSKVSYFFKDNAEKIDDLRVIVTTRFKDEDGNPIPWMVRQLTQEESDRINKDCTTVTRKKGNIIENLDNDKFTKTLILEAVVEPNLKDKTLLESWGVIDPKLLLSKMLNVGEYATLAEAVLKHNNLDDEEVVEAAKNF